MIPLAPVIALVAAVTLAGTLAAVRAVSSPRPRRNRRTHRLAAWLSISPSLWRGPRRWLHCTPGFAARAVRG